MRKPGTLVGAGSETRVVELPVVELPVVELPVVGALVVTAWPVIRASYAGSSFARTNVTTLSRWSSG